MAQYADLTDFARFGLPASVTAGLTTDTINAHLAAASEDIDDRLRGVVSLPLVAPYPKRIVKAACAIAALSILDTLGWNPEVGEDKRIKDRADSYDKWLDRVAAGDAWVYGIVDQTPDVEEDAPEVWSDGSRGI